MGIQITNSGLHTTVQDKGRHGYQRYGFSVSGAMDSFSYRLANLLVSNTFDEAVLEMAVMGASFSFDESKAIVITGADCRPKINGQPIKMYQTVMVSAGDELTTSGIKEGVYSYIGFAGGLKLPEVMGSQSTSTRYGIGGLEGRVIQTGDRVEFKAASHSSEQLINRTLSYNEVQKIIESDTIRFIPSSDTQVINEETHQLFTQNEYAISVKSDRMGYRLQGKAVKTDLNQDIISEATVLGDIQIPPDGQPIVLLADRQTTGGYPVIGTICSVDLPKMVQSSPGKRIKFVPISLEEARNLLLEQEETFSQWEAHWNRLEVVKQTEAYPPDDTSYTESIEWETDQVKEIVRTVDQSSLTYFSYESDHMTLKLEKRIPQMESAEMSEENENSTVPQQATELIQSTLVGVYFTHSEKGNHLFVEAGDAIQVGQVVGRIEALNISNDVIAMKTGIIKSIYVTNDQAVEYGSPIMEVEVNSES